MKLFLTVLGFYVIIWTKEGKNMFFKSKAQKELDGIIFELKNFLSNNYKDQAHLQRKLLAQRCEELFAQNKLKKEQYDFYMREYEKYTQSMKNYHH